MVFVPLVASSEKAQWANYSSVNQGWIQDGLERRGLGIVSPGKISSEVFPFPGSNTPQLGAAAPVWQVAPAPDDVRYINLDLRSIPSFDSLIDSVVEKKEPAISEIMDLSYLYRYSVVEGEEENESGHEEEEHEDKEDRRLDADVEEDTPHACIIQPVFQNFDEGAPVVGLVVAVFPWSLIFKNDELIRGMYAVVDDACSNSSRTYWINKKTVTYLGQGDLHETRFDYLGSKSEFELSESEEEEEEEEDDERRMAEEKDEEAEEGGAEEGEDEEGCEVSFWFSSTIFYMLRYTSSTRITDCFALILILVLLNSTSLASTRPTSCTKPMSPIIRGFTRLLWSPFLSWRC